MPFEQIIIIQFLGKRPSDAGRMSSLDVLANSATSTSYGYTDLIFTESTRVVQSQHFTYHTHG